MATTLTVVVCDGSRVLLGHVGDSRAYLLRDGVLAAGLPRPHLRPAPGGHGPALPRAAARHPWSNVVLRSPGRQPDAGAAQELDLVELDVGPGDRLLLCSDGLTDLVADGGSRRCCGSPTRTPRPRCSPRPRSRPGARDNVTCVVLDLVRRPAGRRRRAAARRGARHRPTSSTPAGPVHAARQRCDGPHGRSLDPVRCQNRGMTDVRRPALEGTVAVRDERRLSFAEYGTPPGPGDRLDARHPRCPPADPRSRPGRTPSSTVCGSSASTGPASARRRRTSTRRRSTGPRDLEIVARHAGHRHARLIGLSGGGPYALAAGAALPDRVHGVGVLGGVAPTRGPDAIEGGPSQLAVRLAPLHLRSAGCRSAWRSPGHPGGPAPGRSGLDLSPPSSPRATRRCWRGRSSRRCSSTTCSTAAARRLGPARRPAALHPHWGFALADVTVPVRWWHGDADHIVPFAHGRHVVDRLPDAELHVIDGREPPRRPRRRRGGPRHAHGARPRDRRPASTADRDIARNA